jgi:hypothetical protein
MGGLATPPISDNGNSRKFAMKILMKILKKIRGS